MKKRQQICIAVLCLGGVLAASVWAFTAYSDPRSGKALLEKIHWWMVCRDQPVPEAWVGKWEYGGGISIRCGGIAGNCSVGDSAEPEFFTIKTNGSVVWPNRREALCFERHGVRFLDETGSARPSELKEIRIDSTRETITVGSLGYDGYSNTYYQPGSRAIVVPPWLVGSWQIPEGPHCDAKHCQLRIDKFGVWVANQVNGTNKHLKQRPNIGRFIQQSGPAPKDCVSLRHGRSLDDGNATFCRSSNGSVTVTSKLRFHNYSRASSSDAPAVAALRFTRALGASD